MRPVRVAILVIGSLLVIPAIAMLLSGGALSLGYVLARDDDGYLTAELTRVDTDSVAVTAEDLDFATDPGTPSRLVDAIDADVRIEATNVGSGDELFVGIAAERDLDAYLAGVAHDEVSEIVDSEPVYLGRDGTFAVNPPVDEDFWAASATGPDTVTLDWEAASGRWAAVIMNADGSPGVGADVDVGARAGFILPLGLSLLGVGTLLTALAVGLIVAAALGIPHEPSDETATRGQALTGPGEPHRDLPVSLEAELDPDLSRWKWMVKWLLAIPHFIVLAFLLIAFSVLTVIAGFSILFTGRYPRSIFDFNLGVLRWAWRVDYYASSGGLGTDRYPPFSLGAEPDYPARLDIDYPEKLSRLLVLVKWWLLAIPHYLIVGLLIGGSVRWATGDGDVSFDPTGGAGLLGLLVFVAGLILLFSGSYPKALFNLVIGLNRWIYRVIAYAALMTDRYPPFRLDQGGSEPGIEPGPPPPPAPSPAAVALDDTGGEPVMGDDADDESKLATT